MACGKTKQRGLREEANRNVNTNKSTDTVKTIHHITKDLL